jgi:hypothetical protein
MEIVSVFLTESQIDKLLGENQTYTVGGSPYGIPIIEKGITSINLSPIDITHKEGYIHFNENSASIRITGKSKADITVKMFYLKQE